MEMPSPAPGEALPLLARERAGSRAAATARKRALARALRHQRPDEAPDV